jgi:PAS domain S-box-containing protein
MAGKSATQQQDPKPPDQRYLLDDSSIVSMADEKGQITYVNENFCKVSRYKREELLGQNYAILNSGHHTKKFMNNLWTVISNGKVWNGQIQNKAKDGSVYWIDTAIMPTLDATHKPVSYVVISNLASLQGVKEDDEIYLRSSIESYKDVLIFSIDKNFKYRIFNSAFKAATLHAYGTEVKEGMSMLDSITVKEDRNKARKNCEKALLGQGNTSLEIYGDLNKIYYETIYSPIVGSDKKIIGVTILSANVTERKIAEEQIVALNKELEAFSYSVAHDLRAPLRSVHGYAQILKEDYEALLDDEGKRIIDVLKSNATRMGKLIDDLLAFSKLGRKEVRRTEIDMAELTQHVISDVIKLTPYNSKVTVGELPPMLGDYGLIYQVMFNLVANAMKYSSKKKLPLVEIFSETRDNELVVCVKDNGAGFDMKYADKLFGIFQRLHTQDEFEGTGVGLAIIQRIIHKHGGQVWVKAKPDQGAQFFFKVPVT